MAGELSYLSAAVAQVGAGDGIRRALDSPAWVVVPRWSVERSVPEGLTFLSDRAAQRGGIVLLLLFWMGFRGAVSRAGFRDLLGEGWCSVGISMFRRWSLRGKRVRVIVQNGWMRFS